MSETKTETPTAEEGQFILTIGERTYDINVIGKAVAYARDFVLAEDIKNAAKNIGVLKPSQLSELLDQALALLQEIYSLSLPATVESTAEDAQADAPSEA